MQKHKTDPAHRSRLFLAGTALIALLGTVAGAQAGHLGNGSQQRVQAVVNRCLAMPHDQMMKDQGCTSTMKQHPELFSAGGAKPQGSP